jgi:ankyrin repeat protein
LHYAATTYDKGIVELLLDNKAEVNACDNKGETPLHCAEIASANADNKDVVELLRQHGGHE